MTKAEEVKAKIENLIEDANTTTGKSDTNLTACVNRLIAGYGQGGSSGENVPEWDGSYTTKTLKRIFVTSTATRVPKEEFALSGTWQEFFNYVEAINYSVAFSYEESAGEIYVKYDGWVLYGPGTGYKKPVKIGDNIVEDFEYEYIPA